jgi:hypothetical protein
MPSSFASRRHLTSLWFADAARLVEERPVEQRRNNPDPQTLYMMRSRVPGGDEGRRRRFQSDDSRGWVDTPERPRHTHQHAPYPDTSTERRRADTGTL